MTGPEHLPSADALFERAPCGLVVTQEDGTILRSNQTFAQWLGFEAQQLPGQRFQNLLTIGGRIFHQTHWAPLMRMQGSVAEVKLDLLHRDGRLVTLLLNGIRREHEHGVCYELALFGLIERDRYERELLAARRRAEQLLAERSSAELALQQAKTELAVAYRQAQRRASFAEQMVAVASHDLKNPLTAIKMASGLLARGERSAREQLLVDNIQVSCERAQRMIADLLDLASVRIGHGISIRRRPVQLHDLIAEGVAEWRVAFAQAQIRYLGRNRGTVFLDPDRLYQALGNLVANGATYGDLRYPITLTSDVSAAFTTFTVHNHGPVIPASQIARLFEPMTRASERSAGVRSVGLGLFIVKEIVNAHGGEIAVHSCEAAGTTFTLRLPALPPTAPNEALAP